MLPHFASRSSPTFYRVLNIVCVVFICCYIFFDVLDIDGSNFSRWRTSMERTAITALVPDGVDLQDLSEQSTLWDGHVMLLGNRFEEFSRHLRPTNILTLSPLVSIRTHGYHVGLPRDAVPD
jgi:hypothetical protein